MNRQRLPNRRESEILTFDHEGRTYRALPWVAASAFDGTNDYLVRGGGLTGAADGKLGIFSAWLKFNGGDGVQQYILLDDGGLVRVERTTANKIKVRMVDASVSIVCLEMDTASTITAASGKVHIAATWDVGSAYAKIFLNGVDDTAGGATISNTNIDYTRGNFGIGATVAGAQKMNAEIGQVYFDTAATINLASNIGKFYRGRPVDMGADGSW